MHDVPLIPAVDPTITLVDRDRQVLRIEFVVVWAVNEVTKLVTIDITSA